MPNGTPLPFQFSAEFLAFLQNAPQVLAKLVDVAKEWYKLQDPQLPPVSTGGGPKHFDIGGTHALQTTEITDEFLEAIAKSYATAEVKEKAIQFIKGFISGISVAGGA